MTLQNAADAWSQTTTGAPPSRTYVEASRRLYSALAAITKGARDRSCDEMTYQALLRGASNMATIVPLATPWVARLLDSGTLYMHARHSTPRAEDLTVRLAGRVAVATHADVPALAAATWEAQGVTGELARHLPPTLFTLIVAHKRGCYAEL